MSPADLPALPITCTVPEYGFAVYDHKTENPSYEAAKAGLIPTIEYGIGETRPRKRVPVRVALARMAGNDQALYEALCRDFLVRLQIFREAKAKRRAVA